MKSVMELEGFTGTFTDEFRKMMHERRKADGLSYSKLADLLQVSWLTIRNWEKGKSCKCHPSKITRVRNYLNGRLTMAQDSRNYPDLRVKTMRRFNGFSENKVEMLDKICKIYDICSQSKLLREKLVQEIMRLSSEALTAFARIEA